MSIFVVYLILSSLYIQLSAILIDVNFLPCRVGSVVSVSTSPTVSSPPGRVIPKTIIKMVQTASLHGTHVLELEFDSAARLSKRPGSVWNCLRGHALKRSPGINRKGRVLYPCP